MTTETSIFSLETWICPVQYGIYATAEDGDGATEGSGSAETEGETATEQEASEGTEGGEQQAATEEKPAKKAWYTERIDKLTAQKHELESRNQTLAQQNANLQAFMQQMLAAGATPAQASAATGALADGMAEAGNTGVGKPAAGDPRGRLYTQAEIDAMIEERAAAKANQEAESRAIEAFNSRCNAVAAKGEELFGPASFKQAVTTLGAAGVNDRAFLEAVTEFDEAPAILHFLGQEANVSEAMRIKGMSAVAQGAALAKIAAKVADAGKAPVRAASNAPPPPTHVGGRASPPAQSLEGLAEAKDDAAWIALREKQLAERRGMH